MIKPIINTILSKLLILIKKPIVLFILLTLVVVGIAAYLYYQNSNLNNKIQALEAEKQPSKTEEENQQLINQVAQLIELPTGEIPTIATVTDKEKLKDQPFFTNAENGDRVLVYTTSKKAILFRPATNKVIDIAPISIGDQKTTPTTPTKKPSPKPTSETTPSPTP